MAILGGVGEVLSGTIGKSGLGGFSFGAIILGTLLWIALEVVYWAITRFFSR